MIGVVISSREDNEIRLCIPPPLKSKTITLKMTAHMTAWHDYISYLSPCIYVRAGGVKVLIFATKQNAGGFSKTTKRVGGNHIGLSNVLHCMLLSQTCTIFAPLRSVGLHRCEISAGQDESKLLQHRKNSNSLISTTVNSIFPSSNLPLSRFQ